MRTQLCVRDAKSITRLQKVAFDLRMARSTLPIPFCLTLCLCLVEMHSRRRAHACEGASHPHALAHAAATVGVAHIAATEVCAHVALGSGAASGAGAENQGAADAGGRLREASPGRQHGDTSLTCYCNLQWVLSASSQCPRTTGRHVYMRYTSMVLGCYLSAKLWLLEEACTQQVLLISSLSAYPITISAAHSQRLQPS